MKGLILKDIFSIRGQIFIGLGIMLLPNLEIAFAGVNDIIENNADETFGSLMTVMMFALLNYVSIVVCSSFWLNTVQYDEQSGWRKYERAMPVTPGQIMSAKFITMAAVVGFVTVLSLIFNIVNVVVHDVPSEPLMALPPIIFLLQMSIMSAALVMGYRLGAKVVTIAYVIFVILFLAAGISLFVLSAKYLDVTFTAVRVFFYAVFPLIAAAVVALCYFKGKKAVEVDI